MAYLLSSFCTETFAKLCIGLPHLISAAFVCCAVEWVSCWTSLFIIFTATAKVYSAQMSGQKFELCPSSSRYHTLQYEPKRGVILCEIFFAKHFSLVFVADSAFCNSCYCFSLAFVVYSRTVLQQTICLAIPLCTQNPQVFCKYRSCASCVVKWKALCTDKLNLSTWKFDLLVLTEHERSPFPYVHFFASLLLGLPML